MDVLTSREVALSVKCGHIFGPTLYAYLYLFRVGFEIENETMHLVFTRLAFSMMHESTPSACSDGSWR